MSRRGRSLAALLLCAVLALASLAAQARADVNVQYPGTAGLGKPFMVRVTSTEPLTGVELVWQGRTTRLAVTVWNERYIALGMLGAQSGKVKAGDHAFRLRLIDGKRKSEHLLPVKLETVKYREDRLTLPDKMVNPPASELKRIEEERRLTAEAIATMTERRDWRLPFVRPVPGIVTSEYGRRRILNGRAGNPHAGIDFRAASGTPVMAAAAGRVVLAGDHYFAGKSVYVDSGGGMITMYFHMSSLAVKKGDLVAAGQVVGASGSTGRSTGPHLHFGLALTRQLVDADSLFSSTSDKLLEKSVFTRIDPVWK